MNRTRTSASEVAELLGLSKRITYRRLNGETPFSDYEFALLCKHLGIPSNALWEQSLPPLHFVAPIPADQPFVKQQYLARLQRAALAGKNQDVVTEGVIASDYLPLFYVYSEPSLALLTLYLFELPLKRTRVGQLLLEEYTADNLDWLAATGALSSDWFRRDSTEVWGHNTLDYLLGKLLSLRTSGLLPRDADVATLFEALDRLVDRLEQTLTSGDKPASGGGKLQVYRDWSSTVRNMMLLRGPRYRTLFLTFGTANFLNSNQPEAIDYFERYFEAMQRISEPVTGRAGGIRSMVNDLRRSVRDTRRRMELIAG